MILVSTFLVVLESAFASGESGSGTEEDEEIDDDVTHSKVTKLPESSTSKQQDSDPVQVEQKTQQYIQKQGNQANQSKIVELQSNNEALPKIEGNSAVEEDESGSGETESGNEESGSGSGEKEDDDVRARLVEDMVTSFAKAAVGKNRTNDEEKEEEKRGITRGNELNTENLTTVTRSVDDIDEDSTTQTGDETEVGNHLREIQSTNFVSNRRCCCCCATSLLLIYGPGRR